jgi:hypothetical protein
MAFYSLPFGQLVELDIRVDSRDPRPQHLAEVRHLRRGRRGR